MGIVKQDLLTNCIYPQGFGTGHSSAPCQPYQSYLLECVYQMVTKEFKYKKGNKHSLKDIFDVGYTKKKLDKGDIFYIIKKPNEMFINFFDIKLRCKKYKSIFPFISLLYNYFKLNNTEQNQASDITLLSIRVLPSIIKSTASTKAVGSEYAFRGWNYITVIVCYILGKISLHTNMTTWCCFNIGYGVTFIDCIWLLKNASTEKIVKMATLLNIKGIKFLKHELDKFVAMFLYFFDTNLIKRPTYTHIY